MGEYRAPGRGSTYQGPPQIKPPWASVRRNLRGCAWSFELPPFCHRPPPAYRVGSSQLAQMTNGMMMTGASWPPGPASAVKATTCCRYSMLSR